MCVHACVCMCTHVCMSAYGCVHLFLIEFFLHICCVSCFIYSQIYLGDCFISVHRALTVLLFSQLFMASHFAAGSQVI